MGNCWQKKMNSINRNNKENATIVFLAICFLIYKLILEYGFWYVLKPIYILSPVYKFDFSLSKYITGFIWLIILFLLIKHNEHKPSVFFLQMHYAIAIIPITIIYSFSDENTLYFFAICTGYGMAEILIYLYKGDKAKRIKLFDKKIFTVIVIVSFYLSNIIVYFDIVYENGLVSFRALNIFDVYSIRGEFQLNKYIGYMFSWQYMVINPFFMIRSMKHKKWFSALLFMLLQLIAYLYAAQKTILFVIPLIFLLYFISKNNYFVRIIYFGLTCLVTLSVTLYNFFEVATETYGLFVRRVLFVPANLKYLYYDFFSHNDKIGFAGTLIGKLIGSEYPYDDTMGFMISKIYFNDPDMSSNTGFLAEGYYRFGIFGILISLLVFCLLLILIDRFAKNNDYDFAIAFCFFSVFLLNDGALIDPLIFGNLTVLVYVMLFYRFKNDKNNNYVILFWEFFKNKKQ